MGERVARVKELLATIPRASLAHLPTPLDHCANLTRALGGPRIWIKRDDCTGLAFGGNKTRQLEYVLGDALAHGADCVIQGAGAQSNHSRQLAAAAARLGIECYLTPRRDGYLSPPQGNLLVASLLATELRPVPAGATMRVAKAELADELRRAGKNPYVVGMGATRSLALAAVGYVGATVEIVEQLAASGESPGCIYTTSQGGTQAGLQLGAALLGLDTDVVGINPMRADHEAYADPAGIAELYNIAAEILGVDVRATAEDITNLTDYVGPRYGVPSEPGLEAMRLLARHEGILLDPVYTAKGFSGFADHIRTGRIAGNRTAVFVHTGGLPAVFAYSEEVSKGGQL
jgi:1-aminocyclopropane-1-carboxylate deaminase/D-cysteine desulfhydrase-like pyridoxal-dependent ACC family enzyme